MTADYVQYIRSLVGSKPIILAGAAVVVCNNSGKILVQRRSDDGLWSFPGGMMEIGESIEDTARRELMEEVKVAANRLIFCGIFSGPKAYHKYPNGDEVWNITVVYASRIADAVGEAASETKETRWVDWGFEGICFSTPTLCMLENLGSTIERNLFEP